MAKEPSWTCEHQHPCPNCTDNYLLVIIGPLGLTYPAEVRWLSEPPENLAQYTRGEGQALLFKLEKWDCSTEFNAALKDGQAAEGYGKCKLELVLRYRPDGK